MATRRQKNKATTEPRVAQEQASQQGNKIIELGELAEGLTAQIVIVPDSEDTNFLRQDWRRMWDMLFDVFTETDSPPSDAVEGERGHGEGGTRKGSERGKGKRKAK